MKIGHMMYPTATDPANDGAMIDDAIRLAKVTEEAGLDAVWLAEHHFSGQCLYADPLMIAAAIATHTRSVELGVAVIQGSLHHPVHLAERLSLIDNLSKGRLLTGLGYGTIHATYEWAGFGAVAEEARDKLVEVEAIMRAAWDRPPASTEPWTPFRGRFFQLDIPPIRPTPYSKPHPRLTFPSTSEASARSLGAKGLPMITHMIDLQKTTNLVNWYREGARDAGRSEDEIADLLGQAWCWRQAYVAPTDAEAEIGLEYHKQMVMDLFTGQNRLFKAQGRPLKDGGEAMARSISDRLFWGAPETIAARVKRELEPLGIGGVFFEFRFGGMTADQAEGNLRMFADKVAPLMREKQTEAA